MDSLLWLQQSFGVLALLLSALLVATLMTALLADQVRQIGALKAVGARTSQIAGSYAGMVTVLAVSALVIGWPLGRLAAGGYIKAVGGILNFDVDDVGPPLRLIVGQTAVGLVVPLLAAAAPVLRAARADTASALREHGVTAPTYSSRRGARIVRYLIARLPQMPAMATRNVFRRRVRLVVTVTALALGGSTFIAALNLTTSLNTTLDGQADALRYDIAVDLVDPFPTNRVSAAVRTVPGVAEAETWLSTPVSLGDSPTTATTPTLYGVAPDTRMLALPVLSGRWLRPEDTDAIVLSHNLAKAYPALRAGADVRLRIQGRVRDWHVVGIVRQVAAPPAAWTTYDNLAPALAPGTTNALRILTDGNDAFAVTATRRALEKALTAAGITVATNRDTGQTQKVLRDHILVISTFLGLLTLLSVVIGGLGLATTMAINVIERIREIGILRALGAGTAAVTALVLAEAGLVGALSWLAALILAVPASIVFGQVIGEILLESPLDLAVNPLAPFIWLAAVVVLAGLAGLAPARRAAALTVRDTLTRP
jgi:putative ABC transport system permease protein